VKGFRATGRHLAAQLFGLSIVCWWMIGLGFSGLWWLNNAHQLAWILFCYAWEVPAIGWTGVVLVPWLRWRGIGRLLEAEDQRAVHRLSRYPRFVAMSAILTSTVGYVLGAFQLVGFARLPTLEAWKIAVQGPVLGAVLSAAMFLTAERATRAVTLSPALRLVAARDAAAVRYSVARKIRYITITIALGAATPIFLFGVTREQQRLEQLRAMALGHALADRAASAAPLGQGTVEALPKLGPNTRLYAVSPVVAPESAGVAVPLFRARHATVVQVGDLWLDANPVLSSAADGWFASRYDGHRVVAFRRDPPVLLIAVSPLSDYGDELIRASAAAAAVMVVALTVASLLSVTFARSLVDPLRRLRQAVGEMAEGKRDVEALAAVTAIGGDEVVALTYQFDAMAARVREEEGRLRAAYDELAIAQHQLVQSEKLSAVGRVVSGIAHELNNPLAAILLFAENLLSGGDPHSAADTEMLRQVSAQAHRARAIVGDLLSFVRAREHRRDTADIRDSIERAAVAVAPAVAEAGARLTVSLGQMAPLVQIDALGIEQVLTNLVANGAQAAGPGGRVLVILEPGEATVRVHVEDTGPGIPAEAMPRIFEPFFTTKGIGKGTGLGLSVSLGIVQQHNGTLVASNLPAASGGGAQFTLELPAHPDQAAARAELRERERRQNGRDAPMAMAGTNAAQPRIMVIDDEQPIRAALRRHLERAGWTVDEAPSGRTALTRLLPSPPGLYAAVITDLMMPDGTGIEVYDQLSATRPDLLSRLIILTGDTSSHAVASFRVRAARPFLDKPFEFLELDEMLGRVLSEAGQATRTPTSMSPM
jgi:signal transduction histidine kinase/ActR/RegA family two-component response regulator